MEKIHEKYIKQDKQKPNSVFAFLDRLVAQLDRLVAQFKQLDRVILVLVLILILIGFAMVFSATMYLDESGTGITNPYAYFIKQFGAFIMGIFGFSAIIMMPYDFFAKLKPLLFFGIGVAVLLFLTYLKGAIGGGAKSWLLLGPISFQPSELSKIGLTLLIAWLSVNTEREHILSAKGFRVKDFHLSVAVILITVLLIFIQPDFGMLIIISLTNLISFVVNHYNKRINQIFWIASLAIITFLYWFIRTYGHQFIGINFRIDRFISFINPFDYARNEGYQLINGYLAFSRGGWFGRGLGQSITKQGFLPAGHTDFILAVIAEELGFVGVSVVVLLFFALFFYLYRWASACQDSYRRHALTGLTTLLLIQAMINMGGATGLVPLTGVTLPFISYGGSSLLISILMIGIIQRLIIAEKCEPRQTVSLNLVHSKSPSQVKEAANEL
ncbi:FtsW/RodA/SpoVE family cell cycle protein [Vaginisenegalia massiliensis]|uniref:FtsW/RodA/SpoVE family cell cycle protein n=1 Tax=Vaginisenegalia massiliensis TaxID=2058294 RepID=UPI000F537E61|nr:FtsW/RodA/SpoVE family cell cycle protein [Vaginisenegalia massiliensis]